MFFELLLMVLNFDFFGIINLLLRNLFWVFGFIALGYFFFGSKKALKWFIVLSLAPVLLNSFLGFIGWKEFNMNFLGLYYVFNLSALKFAESTKFFENRLPYVEEITMMGSLIIFNLFM
ncbi:MAG: hypothetical protein ABIA76_00935 [Candidatus Diapherotrites archaeon]